MLEVIEKPNDDSEIDPLEIFFEHYSPGTMQDFFLTTQEIIKNLAALTLQPVNQQNFYTRLRKSGFKTIILNDEYNWMVKPNETFI